MKLKKIVKSSGIVLFAVISIATAVLVLRKKRKTKSYYCPCSPDICPGDCDKCEVAIKKESQE